MKIVQTPKDIEQKQIEDFPKDTKRSHKGALYVYPGRTMILTDDEAKRVVEEYPAAAKRFVVTDMPDPGKDASEPESTPEAKTAEDVKDAPGPAKIEAKKTSGAKPKKSATNKK